MRAYLNWRTINKLPDTYGIYFQNGLMVQIKCKTFSVKYIRLSAVKDVFIDTGMLLHYFKESSQLRACLGNNSYVICKLYSNTYYSSIQMVGSLCGRNIKRLFNVVDKWFIDDSV